MLPLKLHYRQQNKTHTQNYLELSQTVDELPAEDSRGYMYLVRGRCFTVMFATRGVVTYMYVQERK